MALGLDQIPESLLPLLVCMPLLGLSWQQVLLLTLTFIAAELLLSQALYRLEFGGEKNSIPCRRSGARVLIRYITGQCNNMYIFPGV